MFEVYGQPGAPPPWKLHEGRPRQEKKGGLPVEEVASGFCGDCTGRGKAQQPQMSSPEGKHNDPRRL